ncbi:ATP-binding protein [Chlorogloea sp. CCALA 695]|uniref:ATP-binding protein n=1 Tax=Chlorogloea sp. CCALA 695 TaxID=2107693 RepID=UPI000D05A6F6|nr:ATP-binding protein [Chlorogloea sp. CCALA 695]PSB34203.1 histidine kinase [Chlorogloea sp. CCALA 695]
MCTQELLKLELFQVLPPERLNWVCDHAEAIDLKAQEVLVREGDAALGFLILTKGRIGVTRYSDGVEMPIGQHEAPAFFGETQILTGEVVPVTLRSFTDCRLYRLKEEDFLSLLHECRAFEKIIFQTVTVRSRGLESFIRSREKMAALGTLAAGLAHELNNPAAALVRALKDVTPALIELQRMNLVTGQAGLREAEIEQWIGERDRGYEAIVNKLVDPVTIGDREDELLTWLEDYGIEDAWNLATPLAEAGVEIKTLEQLTSPWRNDSGELREMGVRWLGLSFEVMSTIKGGLRSAERISELVQSMKSYSYLDQGAQQLVDVHQGIEDTIRLFSGKLKQGITVKRSYDDTVPQILVYGSELNQVWTNLIDNAIDAMDNKGILELTTKNKGDRLVVTITDSGSGISVEMRSRIFEPFFTTKPVGKGTGLGLDMVRRIVENRHHGSISLDSNPGRTTFSVCLPLH